MRYTVQVKGANGSGKTTIARQLIGLSSMKDEVYSPDLFKGKKPYATVLADLGWVVIGSYPAGGKSGGADLIHYMDDLFISLYKAFHEYPNYWILVEGAMISTTMTTYNFLLQNNMNPLVVILNTTMEGCLRRLEARKGDGVKLTADMFTQLAPKLDRIPKQKHQPEHVRQMYVDRLPLEDMVYEFLAAVDWKVQP